MTDQRIRFTPMTYISGKYVELTERDAMTYQAEGFSKLALCLHRTDRGWSMSEMTTRQAIGFGKTMKEAIQQGTDALVKNGPEKMAQLIKTALSQQERARCNG
jgi:hypothetical protein